MKSKILNKITLVFAVLFFTACEDVGFLNQPPYSSTAPENFYKSEKDFKIALAGCYEVINTSQVPGAWVPTGTYARGLQYMLGGCSDEILSVDTRETADFQKATYMPNNPPLLCFWRAFFAGISRCNFLLDNIDNITWEGNTKTQFVGEARFLRAFYYYHLAACFGGVPINDNSNPDPKAARESLEDVYNFIIADLDYAYKNLNNEGILTSSANKWTAGAYLGMAYNYLASCKRYNVGESLLAEQPLNSFAWVDADKMSEDALEVLSDVVENSPYELLPKSQYTYLFRESTKAFQYKECLLLSEWADSGADRYNTTSEMYSPNGSTGYRGSWGRHKPTNELYYSYVDADIRRDHNITGRLNQNVTETIEGVKYYVPLASKPDVSRLEWCTGKFRLTIPGVNPSFTTDDNSLNYPLMRLADVILQYSEALYFMGDEPNARKLFEQIRGRVAADGHSLDDLNMAYTKSDFVEELLDERKREFCFESKRRIDLIRFDKTTEAINSLSVATAGSPKNFNFDAVASLQSNWKYYKIWFPIPQTEREINTNLTQNAGY